MRSATITKLIILDEKPSKFAVWIQWTLAKLTVKLFGANDCEQRKFIIELEDIITSVDRQDIYMKLKTKITTLRAICKCRSVSDDVWTTNNVLGVTVRAEPSPNAGAASAKLLTRQPVDNRQVDTFFDLTVTRAITRNVHNKWRTKRKRNQNLNDTITEIVINMQTIDVQLDFDLLSTFAAIFAVLPGSDDDLADRRHAATVRSVSDLPLVFFQSKGVRVFLPFLSNTTSGCNVLIFKVSGSVRIGLSRF